MARDDMISASEIGEFLYCHKSWWYKQQGAASANQPEMDRGTAAHVRLGKQAGQVQREQSVGLQLVALALALLVAAVLLKALVG